jgi:hypothetical protein
VVVSPGDVDLHPRDTLRLDADVTDRYGNALDTIAVQWRSSDEVMAVVDGSGLVSSGAVPGAVDITARSGSASGTASVMVMASDPSEVADLRVVSVTEGSVTLGWTQVPDGAGGAAKYALRGVQGTLVWDAASGSQVTIPGTSVGADLNFTVDGLGAERRYEFQVAAYRGSVGTNAVFGAPSTVARATTTSAAPVVARIVVTPTAVARPSGDTATFRSQAQDE